MQSPSNFENRLFQEYSVDQSTLFSLPPSSLLSPSSPLTGTVLDCKFPLSGFFWTDGEDSVFACENIHFITALVEKHFRLSFLSGS